jgi:hypothetical protein
VSEFNAKFLEFEKVKYVDPEVLLKNFRQKDIGIVKFLTNLDEQKLNETVSSLSSGSSSSKMTQKIVEKNAKEEDVFLRQRRLSNLTGLDVDGSAEGRRETLDKKYGHKFNM